jgi:glycosyltransferase involved in cell wall biosynthesis
MKIAICVPCWNHIEYTKQFVDSVLRNSGSHSIGFVFIDNGSTDGTGDYLAHVPKLARLIHNPENVGVNPAWNTLFSIALEYDPEVIVLANNDILCGPSWLDPIVRELAKDDKRYFLPNGQFTNPTTFDADVRAALPSLHGTQPGRAGWCLSFRPNAVPLFHPIPAELKLWFGDDWVHHKLQTEHGYRCEVLLDSCCLHYTSKSISDFPGMVEQVGRDREAYKRLTGGT